MKSQQEQNIQRMQKHSDNDNDNYNKNASSDLKQNHYEIKPLSFYYKQRKFQKYKKLNEKTNSTLQQSEQLKSLKQKQLLKLQEQLKITDHLQLISKKYQIKKIRGEFQIQLQKFKKLQLLLKQIQQNQLSFLFKNLNKIQSVILDSCYRISSFENCVFKTLENLKKIELTELSIKTNIQVNQLNNLETLIISYCSEFVIQGIKISNCKSLRKIVCNFTNVKEIILQNVQKIEHLDVGNNSKFFKKITLNGDYPNLKGVNLSSSLIIYQNLNYILDQSPQIQYLNLSHCLYIRKIQLSFFSNLRIIDLQYSKIQSIQIEDLPSLKILTLWICTALNKAIVRRCPELQTFALYKIQNADTIELQELDSLKVFHLQNCNNLWDLKITKCKSLSKISLGKPHGNGISIVKIYFDQLASLQLLNFFLNSPQSIISVSNCQKLKKFQLFSTKLIKQLKLQKLTQLQELDLLLNTKIQSLQVLDSFNIKILNLERTQFNYNQMFELIKNLTKLQKLNLSYCQLQKLLELHLSQQLKYLVMTNLNSSRMRMDIGQSKLSKMIDLNLSVNKITNIEPISMINLQYMERLNLQGNLIWNCKPFKKTIKGSKNINLQKNVISIYDFERGINEVQTLLGFSLKGLSNTISISKMFKLKVNKLSTRMLYYYDYFGDQKKKQPIRQMFKKRFLINYLT